LVETAVVCPKCGSPTSRFHVNTTSGKRKSTAVLLAVFLGIWSWLYTYKDNAVKFWVTLATLIICFTASFYLDVQALSYGASLEDQALARIAEASVNVVAGAFWIWAIIDNAVKNNEWYRNY